MFDENGILGVTGRSYYKLPPSWIEYLILYLHYTYFVTAIQCVPYVADVLALLATLVNYSVYNITFMQLTILGEDLTEHLFIRVLLHPQSYVKRCNENLGGKVCFKHLSSYFASIVKSTVMVALTNETMQWKVRSHFIQMELEN